MTAFDIISMINWPLVLYGHENFKQLNSSDFMIEYRNMISKQKMLDCELSVSYIKDSDGYHGLKPEDEDLYLALTAYHGKTSLAERSLYIPSFNTILMIMGLSRGTRNYEKIKRSLARLAGVTFKTNKWWSKKDLRYKNKIFHIIDDIEYDNRLIKITWGEPIFEALRQKHYKLLDLDVYFRIKGGGARKLFRLFDWKLFAAKYKEKSTNIYNIRLMFLAMNVLGFPRYKSEKYCETRIKSYLRELIDLELIVGGIIIRNGVKTVSVTRR